MKYKRGHCQIPKRGNGAVSVLLFICYILEEKREKNWAH